MAIEFLSLFMSCDLYVVTYLPKTAGTTLSSSFRANFQGREWLPMSPHLDNRQRGTVLSAIEKELEQKTSRTRCVFGHWAYFRIHQTRRVLGQTRDRHLLGAFFQSANSGFPLLVAGFRNEIFGLRNFVLELTFLCFFFIGRKSRPT